MRHAKPDEQRARVSMILLHIASTQTSLCNLRLKDSCSSGAWQWPSGDCRCSGGSGRSGLLWPPICCHQRTSWFQTARTRRTMAHSTLVTPIVTSVNPSWSLTASCLQSLVFFLVDVQNARAATYGLSKSYFDMLLYLGAPPILFNCLFVLTRNFGDVTTPDSYLRAVDVLCGVGKICRTFNNNGQPAAGTM